jgi:outer membrane protein OmpA-like peptidoglycan-associated protein
LADEAAADDYGVMKSALKPVFPLIFLFSGLGHTVAGQGLPPLAKLAPDQPGCVDSKLFPKIAACRIDNCEKKESDHREIAVSEDEKGDPVTAPMDGNTQAVMYECWTGTTPTSIVEKAEAGLRAAGFEIPYRFADAEASLTAHKDDLWVTVEAASRYYTLTEINAVGPDFESAIDADSMADMLERYGHVPLNGVEFLPGKPDLIPSSSVILEEVAALLKNHPTWHLRVEGHTDNVGSKTSNLNLSFFRASTVVAWLATNGIKRARLDPKGLGDTHPIADNTTETGRNRNRRIELVKIAGLATQQQP